MPRYGFLLTTLIGEKAKRPDVCHGMRHVPTPCSIAFTIASVTLRYPPRFSDADAVWSMLDIVKEARFALFRGRAGLPSVAAPFRPDARFLAIIERQKHAQIRAKLA